MTTQDSDQTNDVQAPELGATLLHVAWLAVILGLVMEVLLLVLGGAVGERWASSPSSPIWSGTLPGLSSSARVSPSGRRSSSSRAADGRPGPDLRPARVRDLARVPQGHAGSPRDHRWRGRRRLPGAGRRYQGDRVRVPWPGGRLGEPAQVGRRCRARCGGAAGWPDLRGVQLVFAAGATPPPPTSDLFVAGVNEVLFPVGCSLVLFSAGALGKKAASRSSR